ncbi:MAG: hypothetical protein ACK4F4_07140 [Hylemonella sp.]|uniref:hypothetical protein n=1 Tax=Hylemonella sp. TaxID=2066020 RepID=UPI00391B4E82
MFVTVVLPQGLPFLVNCCALSLCAIACAPSRSSMTSLNIVRTTAASSSCGTSLLRLPTFSGL